MLEKPPTSEEMINLMGKHLFDLWNELSEMIEKKYDMERLWNSGGKVWTYEYKYRRGGKTFCALYAREKTFGFMLIFGKDERAKFEADRESYSAAVQKIYDESKTYHDGKWVMYKLTDQTLFPDLGKLLLLKRRPNRVTQGNH